MDNMNVVDFDTEGVTEIHGTNIIKRARLINKNLCYIGVQAKLFIRTVYRRPHRPEVLVEQTIYPGRRAIQNSTLPRQAKNSKAELRQAIVLHEPDLGNPGNILMRGPSIDYFVNDINWDDVAHTLSKYAKRSNAFPERKKVFGVQGDIAFGEIKVMTPQNQWRELFWSQPEGNVANTTCACCLEDFLVEDPNYIDEVTELPCRHIFHKKCIYKWIWTNQVYNVNNRNYHSFCPSCGGFIC